MKLSGFNRVLCLSPHPDDVELGMLGSILKFKDTVFDVLCLTVGTATDPTSNESRNEEMKALWNNANTQNVNISFSGVNFLHDRREDEWLTFIEKTYLANHEYDCIFLPPFDDSHYEHRFVAGFGSALTRAKPISLIQYRTVATLNSWVPNLFIDIEDTYDQKVELLKEFNSQSDSSYFSEDVIRAFHINFHFYKKGLKFTEQFHALNLLG